MFGSETRGSRSDRLGNERLRPWMSTTYREPRPAQLHAVCLCIVEALPTLGMLLEYGCRTPVEQFPMLKGEHTFPTIFVLALGAALRNCSFSNTILLESVDENEPIIRSHARAPLDGPSGVSQQLGVLFFAARFYPCKDNEAANRTTPIQATLPCCIRFLSINPLYADGVRLRRRTDSRRSSVMEAEKCSSTQLALQRMWLPSATVSLGARNRSRGSKGRGLPNRHTHRGAYTTQLARPCAGS